MYSSVHSSDYSYLTMAVTHLYGNVDKVVVPKRLL